jgi:GTP cyclohydrolase III
VLKRDHGVDVCKGNSAELAQENVAGWREAKQLSVRLGIGKNRNVLQGFEVAPRTLDL